MFSEREKTFNNLKLNAGKKKDTDGEHSRIGIIGEDLPLKRRLMNRYYFNDHADLEVGMIDGPSVISMRSPGGRPGSPYRPS